MTFTKTALGSVLLILLSANASAVSCANENTAVPASTPAADFTVHNDGTVTHNSTGLMWMQCSLGQSWDGATCTGSASDYNWQNALAAGNGYSFAGYTDWRLPNKNELASIVEQRCHNPAINTAIFPATPSDWFWSSSPYAGASYSAWYVNFGNGYVGDVGKHNYDYYRVRLVRAGQ